VLAQGSGPCLCSSDLLPPPDLIAADRELAFVSCNAMNRGPVILDGIVYVFSNKMVRAAI
jgi:hypothetical protein